MLNPSRSAQRGYRRVAAETARHELPDGLRARLQRIPVEARSGPRSLPGPLRRVLRAIAKTRPRLPQTLRSTAWSFGVALALVIGTAAILPGQQSTSRFASESLRILESAPRKALGESTRTLSSWVRGLSRHLASAQGGVLSVRNRLNTNISILSLPGSTLETSDD